MAEPLAPVEQQQPTPQPVPPVAAQRPGAVPVVGEEPPTQEKRTIPPEIPYAAYHMAELDEKRGMGIMAKFARGGWKRISMNTVQSDDDRFTITQIDPTRRSKWFLLKDMETGETYEETTMTGAKKKAKELRGDAGEFEPDEDDLEGLEAEPDPPQYTRTVDKSNTEPTYRTAKLAVEDTMAGQKKTAVARCPDCSAPVQAIRNGFHCTKCDKDFPPAAIDNIASSKWARLRQVAAEEPKEADAAIAEVAEALGTMADALSNLKENLDLVTAPKTASIKVRVTTARKYATAFRRIAEEAPEVVAGAISEVYHSLDDVAGALENLAEHMGIELSLTQAEKAFGEEGQSELAGEWGAEEPESGAEPKVDEEQFEEAEKELESPEAAPAEEKLDEEIEKEAAATEWTTDRDEGSPKSPVIAAKKKEFCSQCGSGHGKPGTLCKRHGKTIPEKKEKKADAAFISDRDENGKPEAPSKLDKAAKRAATRERIAKRWGVTV